MKRLIIPLLIAATITTQVIPATKQEIAQAQERIARIKQELKNASQAVKMLDNNTDINRSANKSLFDQGLIRLDQAVTAIEGQRVWLEEFSAGETTPGANRGAGVGYFEGEEEEDTSFGPRAK